VDRARRIIPLALRTYGIIGLIGIALIYFGHGKLTGLKQAFQINHALEIIVYGVASGLIIIILSLILARWLGFIKALEDEFASLLGGLSLGQCLVLALTSGIAEEILFRGALQPWLGLVATSIIFGLAHFPVKKSLVPWTVFALLMGLLLGWLYIVTQSLWTPIITHSLINLVNLYRISKEGISTNEVSGFPDTTLQAGEHP